MYKCDLKTCMYYTLIKKKGKYKGFCDLASQFFEEMSPDQLKERTENCSDCKPKPTTTKI